MNTRNNLIPAVLWNHQAVTHSESSLIAGAYNWSWTCCKSGAINLLWVIRGHSQPQSASARNRRAKVELHLLPLFSFTVSLYRLLCPIFFASLSFPPPSLNFLSRSPAGSEPSISVLFPLIPIFTSLGPYRKRWAAEMATVGINLQFPLWSVTYFTQNGKYKFKTFCGIYWPFCLYLAGYWRTGLCGIQN